MYYLSWLRNKVLRNDPEVEKKQGWAPVGDLEGCTHYRLGEPGGLGALGIIWRSLGGSGCRAAPPVTVILGTAPTTTWVSLGCWGVLRVARAEPLLVTLRAAPITAWVGEGWGGTQGHCRGLGSTRGSGVTRKGQGVIGGGRAGSQGTGRGWSSPCWGGPEPWIEGLMVTCVPVPWVCRTRVCGATVKYERIKFLVIALKSSVEVYAWAPRPYHKFMAFKVRQMPGSSGRGGGWGPGSLGPLTPCPCSRLRTCRTARCWWS